MTMLFCGLDVGTTGVKAVVFDEGGNRITGAYRAYDIHVAAGGTRLLRGQELWDKTKAALAEAAARAGGTLSALCAASFGEAFVAVNDRDEIICDPMLFTDRWGEEEYREAEKKTSPREIARICGLPAAPAYSLSKVLFLREQHPRIYEQTKKILLIQDFINYLLCGRRAVDYSAACRTMFFDVRECAWSGELIARFGLEPRHYPEPRPMGTVLGELRPAVARELGLGGRVKVVLGGHDQPVNAIGAGLREGYAVCSMGTTECITPVTGGMLAEDFIAAQGIPSEPLWEKGKFCCLAYNPGAGLLVQWFFQTFTDEKDPPYGLFDRNLPAAPTKIMVQPYLMGSGTPYMDNGARLAVTGMDLGTTKFDIYRAVLEGLSLDQRLNLSVLAEERVSVDHIIAVGGGSKNRPWLEIKADILQIPVSVLRVQEAGALGCAVICAAACGVYGSLEEAARTMSSPGETVEPNPRYREFYREKFELYRKLHGHVQEESAFAVGGAAL
jgi:xylulokinase